MPPSLANSLIKEVDTKDFIKLDDYKRKRLFFYSWNEHLLEGISGTILYNTPRQTSIFIQPQVSPIELTSGIILLGPNKLLIDPNNTFSAVYKLFSF